jgi:hypothetical protein
MIKKSQEEKELKERQLLAKIFQKLKKIELAVNKKMMKIILFYN